MRESLISDTFFWKFVQRFIRIFPQFLYSLFSINSDPFLGILLLWWCLRNFYKADFEVILQLLQNYFKICFFFFKKSSKATYEIYWMITKERIPPVPSSAISAGVSADILRDSYRNFSTDSAELCQQFFLEITFKIPPQISHDFS